MKKSVCLLFFLGLLKVSFSQEPAGRNPSSAILRPTMISAGVNTSLGNLSSSHPLGFTIEYSRSRYSYGKSAANLPFRFSYVVNAGGHYFWGARETISNYSYNYPGLSWIYVSAGVMAVKLSSFKIAVSAGPALKFYNGNTGFAFTSNATMNYFVKDRISVSPFFQLFKESGTHINCLLGIKSGFAF